MTALSFSPRKLIICSIWIIFIILFAKQNLIRPNLWYDEAGQFWIALGLNHMSPSHSKSGDIYDVIENNKSFNLDPGGFSVLLHYWTKLSTNHIFLRILPYIFFILAALTTSRIAQIWQPNSILAPFSGLLLISSEVIRERVFEIRAYSMELFALTLSLYLLYQHNKIFSNKRYAILSGLLLSFLTTSRYSAYITVSVLFLLLFIKIIVNNHIKKQVIFFLLFTIPSVIVGATVYNISLSYQNPQLTPPSYVSNLVLGASTDISQLVNWATVFAFTPTVFFCGLFLISQKFTSLKGIIAKYQLFILYTICLNLAFILLSYFGKYTWDVNSKWNISLNALLTISWIPLVLLYLEIVAKLNNRWLQFLFYLLTPSLLYQSYLNTQSYEYYPPDYTYDNLTAIQFCSETRLLANAGSFPVIKYLFEHGPFQQYSDQPVYTNLSTFNHQEYRVETSYIEKNLDQLDYILLNPQGNSLSALVHEYDMSDWEEIIAQSNNQVYARKN